MGRSINKCAFLLGCMHACVVADMVHCLNNLDERFLNKCDFMMVCMHACVFIQLTNNLPVESINQQFTNVI